MLAFDCLLASTDLRSELPLQLLWTVLILTAVVVGAAGIVVGIGRWLKRPPAGRGAADDLASFRVLYERGEFSQEEYERIRSRLNKRLRQELNVPPPAPEAPPAPVDQPAAATPRSSRPDRPHA